MVDYRESLEAEKKKEQEEAEKRQQEIVAERERKEREDAEEARKLRAEMDARVEEAVSRMGKAMKPADVSQSAPYQTRTVFAEATVPMYHPEEAKPVEDVKPVEEAKPAEEPKPSSERPVLKLKRPRE